jgi:hypothetical protein
MKFFISLAVLTAVLATLAQDMGAVIVLWHGYEMRTNIIVAAIAFWGATEILALSLKLGRKMFRRRRKKRDEEAQEDA